MIDCRSLTLDTDRLALVVRASHRHRPPLALLVTADQRAALDAPDGYLDDVPLTTDPAGRPPPKPVPTPEPTPPRPIAELRREHTVMLQATIRDHVDAHLPPSEREALGSIAAGLAEKAAFGVPLTPTEQGVAIGLMQARAWSLGALALAGDAAVRCAACTTLDEVQAVTVDLSALGEPPRITAGEVALALALRGA